MRSSISPWRRVAAVAALVVAPASASAEDAQEMLLRELQALRRQQQELMRKQEELEDTVRRQAETIRRLEARAGARAETPRATAPAQPRGGAPPTSAAPTTAATALDQALEAAKAEAPPPTAAAAPPPGGAAPPGLLSRQVGGATLRLIDTSLDVLFAAGSSTAGDETLAFLEGGAHDPDQRGFTLQQAELSLSGAVDPYFTGEAHISFSPDDIELEEAFLTTQALPYGLQVEAGQFLTEFGRINPTHPHAWQWIDQPVINTRLFGGEGLRNPGVRLGWLVPVSWFSQLSVGAQNATGETAISFLGEDGGGGHEHGLAGDEEGAVGIGGRPLIDRPVSTMGDLLYLTRLENGFSVTDSLYGKLGASALFGPNATGLDARTTIYGLDAAAKWVPADNFRGYPFFLVEGEIMRRRYEAAAVRDETGILPATTLFDWGFYAQALYGFTHPWAAGVRFEYASGSGESVGGRASDPFRDDRFRFSPLLTWRPTEFSRIRLQYNFDHADFLPEGDAHSVWLGFEILYGQHPAHRF